MADNIGIVCLVGPPAIACERHVGIAAKALLDMGREPTGEVIGSRDPCPICLYEQAHGEEVTMEKLGSPGATNVQVHRRKR